MHFYLALPLVFLRFWFVEAPAGMLKFFTALNGSFSRFFSLTLFIKTFFKPWKNEYRKGLVGFSRGMAMFFKSVMILFDLAVLSVLVVFEAVCFVGFLAMPFLTVVLLFFPN